MVHFFLAGARLAYDVCVWPRRSSGDSGQWGGRHTRLPRDLPGRCMCLGRTSHEAAARPPRPLYVLGETRGVHAALAFAGATPAPAVQHPAHQSRRSYFFSTHAVKVVWLCGHGNVGTTACARRASDTAARGAFGRRERPPSPPAPVSVQSSLDSQRCATRQHRVSHTHRHRARSIA